MMAIIIEESIRHGRSVFHGFPQPLSSYYFSQAHIRDQSKRFFPPWLRKSSNGNVEAVETVTLTLDLRKSTFLMEKTVDPKRFADWLAAMVRVLRTIVHRHQGVFDKFTGDGIIAHFPVEDLRMVGCDNACVAAVCCADEMISAIDRLLLGLQPIIRFDSDVFSAGVGIASNRAQWQVDHGRQLIVVGTGVVDACRMSSEAPPRKILMGVNAYHAFKRSGGCPGMRQSLENFSAKGYPDENKLKVWHLERATPFAPHREQWLRDTCDNALEAIDAKVDAPPPQLEAPLPSQCCSNSTCHDGQCKTE